MSGSPCVSVVVARLRQRDGRFGCGIRGEKRGRFLTSLESPISGADHLRPSCQPQVMHHLAGHTLVQKNFQPAFAARCSANSLRTATTCSRRTLGKSSTNSSTVCPPSRYSISVRTGTRVPRKTGVPPRTSGSRWASDMALSVGPGPRPVHRSLEVSFRASSAKSCFGLTLPLGATAATFASAGRLRPDRRRREEQPARNVSLLNSRQRVLQVDLLRVPVLRVARAPALPHARRGDRPARPATSRGAAGSARSRRLPTTRGSTCRVFRSPDRRVHPRRLSLDVGSGPSSRLPSAAAETRRARPPSPVLPR